MTAVMKIKEAAARAKQSGFVLVRLESDILYSLEGVGGVENNNEES